jgi:hypothetical protein
MKSEGRRREKLILIGVKHGVKNSRASIIRCIGGRIKIK